MLALRQNTLGIPILSDAWNAGKTVVKDVFGGGCYVARNVPGISDIVFKNGGCTPEGRKLAAMALQTYAASHGPVAAVLGPIGYAVAVDCVCGSSQTSYVPPPPPPTPWYQQQGVMLGAGVLALGVLAFVMSKKNNAPAAVPASAK